MIARELKEKLRSRQTQIGTFVKLADPTALEVLGLAGMDFAIIDTEHAPCDQMLLLDMIRAADSVGLPTIGPGAGGRGAAHFEGARCRRQRRADPRPVYGRGDTGGRVLHQVCAPGRAGPVLCPALGGLRHERKISVYAGFQ